MSLEENYHAIKQSLPESIQLVAVSKTHPVEKIQTIYQLGQRAFGENKVQEMIAKQPLLPADIEWHLIGHLQTNKVKYIAPFVALIQSVDSKKLLQEINKQAEKNQRIIPILLQVKIAQEDTKTGMDIAEAKALAEEISQGLYPHIALKGLMGIATFTDDENTVQQEFLRLKNFYDELAPLYQLETLSMGMSHDFPLAIACGANSVRIGSAIFGERDYSA
ncbi:YggS family pyridoxal phosphate-dependent enzyme [Riemerella columbina]|uniref:YggS family pyridoxal phosphate-dependent enzyme n=1 Tax=Riemerella columbina TaxID=103810 RepID=UPI0026704B8E|nr:YggS family pyridoxal phosphate-dependent enzyme [Riemerella columbina]WKS96123.1 YggS family pyridoxal phosphate-dependent enzyme [Riemerella columbina]